jgi:hypothetical protein
MNADRRLIRAAPTFEVLETVADGKRFADHIRETLKDRVPHQLVLDLTDTFLDYWGCNPIIECCLELMDSHGQQARTITVVVNTLLYESKDQYSWAFFHNTGAHNGKAQRLDYNAVAVDKCQARNIRFDLCRVDFGPIAEDQAIPPPDFTLSSR